MRTSTTLFTFFLATSLFAQSPYRPFPESNAGWVESHGGLNPGGPSCGDYTFISCTRPTYFGTDSIIGSLSYHRLRYHGLCNWQQINGPMPPPPWCSYSGSYPEPLQDFIFFRQDVTERKVYIYDPAAQQERLLYDFTIGLGTHPLTYNSIITGSGELQVVALDSMELNDGWHRTWVLGINSMGTLQDSAFCTVIEGVGSTFGLVAGLWPMFENYESLDCHSVADLTIHPFGGTMCDLTLVVPAQHAERIALRAFPNPATDVITIAGELPPNARYTMCDALGSIVATGKLQQARIDCSAWCAGVYAVTVYDAGGGITGVVPVVKE